MKEKVECSITLELATENGLSSKTFSVIGDPEFFDMLVVSLPGKVEKYIRFGNKIFKQV